VDEAAEAIDKYPDKPPDDQDYCNDVQEIAHTLLIIFMAGLKIQCQKMNRVDAFFYTC
jgi:hypothetical protein